MNLFQQIALVGILRAGAKITARTLMDEISELKMQIVELQVTLYNNGRE